MKLPIFTSLVLVLSMASCASCATPVPKAVREAYRRAEKVDMIGMPVAFIGSLESVATEPYLNVHGNEWGVVVRVKRVLLGTWSEETLGFGVTSPTHVGLDKGKEYYLVAAHGRHGTIILAVIPVEPEPNKPVETTSFARPEIRESCPFAVASNSVSHG